VASLLLDFLLPQLDDGVARGRHRNPGDPLAQDQAEGFGERRVVLAGDLREVGAEQLVLEHLVDIAAHARHADGAQRFDARLFQRVIGGACLGFRRSALPMRRRVVARKAHGHGVALTARDGDVAARREARQVGEPRLVGSEDRPVGGEGDFEIGRTGNGAQRRAHGGLECRRGVGPVLLAARWLGHFRYSATPSWFDKLTTKATEGTGTSS
jgi:hypothetical protein